MDVSGESIDTEGVSQQHLMTSITFRWVRDDNEDYWELEHVWDGVDIQHLADIGPPDQEWCQMNYNGERHVTFEMMENINIVLVQTILNWSCLDGNVGSQQIVWAGRFADSQQSSIFTNYSYFKGVSMHK